MLILTYSHIVDFLRYAKMLNLIFVLILTFFSCLRKSPLYDYKLKLTFHFIQCNIIEAKIKILKFSKANGKILKENAKTQDRSQFS